MEQLFRALSAVSATSDVAPVVGVVAFSAKHGNIKAVIDSDDRVVQLDSLTGHLWLVFASRMQSKWQDQAAYIVKKSGAELIRRVGKSLGISEIVKIEIDGPTTYGPWLSDKEKRTYLSVLALDSEDDLPRLILIYPAPASSEVRGYINFIALEEGKSTDEAFESLKNALNAVTKAIEGMDPTLRKEADHVFRAVGYRIKQDKENKQFKDALPIFKWAAGKLGLL